LSYWPFWVSGLALASVMVIHWLATGRMMAVSGRFSALVNRLRYGGEGTQEEPMTSEDLVAALRAMTAETFGAAALEPAADAPREVVEVAETQRPPAPEVPERQAPRILGPQPPWLHVVFLSALLLGGFLSALLSGQFSASWGLRGEGFSSTFESGAGSAAALLFGGILTGFGTRMAGGCTSGHGLCGVSRVQPGSLVATAGFFGAGIVLSLILEAL